jgi:hypothetical protein
MRQMVRIEVEVSVNVDDFSVVFGGQCHLFPEDQNIQKGITLSWLHFHGELNERA